jgi:hypothetical protein
MAAKTVIQVRRDTAANWAGKTLADGEIGFVNSGTDKGKFKVGDGTTVWGSLPYANPNDYISSISGSSTDPVRVSSGNLTLAGGFARYTGSGDTHISYPKVTVKSGSTGPASPTVGDVWIKYTV